MKREIMFRGKRLYDGRWVYGAYYEHQPPSQCIAGIDEPSKHCIAKTAFADWNMPRQIECIEVDPETVGQYTTLKDDNDKEIYQGDLVKFNDRTIVYEVIWDPYRVAWWLKDVKADKRERDRDTDHQQLLNNSWQQRVVIGNIYDNPELLEGKK